MKKFVSLLICLTVLLCTLVSCVDDPYTVYRLAIDRFLSAGSYRVVIDAEIAIGDETGDYHFSMRVDGDDWTYAEMISDEEVLVMTQIKDTLFCNGAAGKTRRTVDAEETEALLRPWRAFIDLPELAEEDAAEPHLIGYAKERIFTADVDEARFDEYVENLMYTNGYIDVTTTVSVDEADYKATVDYDGHLTGITLTVSATAHTLSGEDVPLSLTVDLFVDEEILDTTHVNPPLDADAYVAE